jgi:hypothetical protein
MIFREQCTCTHLASHAQLLTIPSMAPQPAMNMQQRNVGSAKRKPQLQQQPHQQNDILQMNNQSVQQNNNNRKRKKLQNDHVSKLITLLNSKYNHL